jgi:hypothetical protein
MADDRYSYQGETLVLKLHDHDVSESSKTRRSSKTCKRVEAKEIGGIMGKKVSVVLLMLSSMFLVAWFPAMTPDQRIEIHYLIIAIMRLYLIGNEIFLKFL